MSANASRTLPPRSSASVNAEKACAARPPRAAAAARESDVNELLTLTEGRARELAEDLRRRIQELEHGI